ncbi:MAG: hypothetical protein JSS36_05600 [Proteobacteria bacterium]|nr:hypothetical protein [Pseudomonadota bacterium]
MSGNPLISKRQFDVLSALKQAADQPFGPGDSFYDHRKGWFLASQLVDKKLLTGGDVRAVLIDLCDSGLVETKFAESGRYFRLTGKGSRKVDEGQDEVLNIDSVDSSKWTGIIEPPKVYQALHILSDMEDACEKIVNNHDRAQIFGLIRALEVLLTIPEPPRQGVVSLLRDPVFGNVVQVATFFVALIGAVKP